MRKERVIVLAETIVVKKDTEQIKTTLKLAEAVRELRPLEADALVHEAERRSRLMRTEGIPDEEETRIKNLDKKDGH